MKKNHAIILIPGLFLALFFTSCKPGVQTQATTPLSKAIDDIATRPINEGRAAGMTIAVAQNGEIIHLKGYGMADLEWDISTPPDATYEIGSVTKQFTSVAVLQLAEQGKLSLQDNLSKYFSDYDFKGHSITVEQLFDHTSGIKSYTALPAFGDLVVKKLPRDTLLRIVEKAGFDFSPGEALIYNNTAYFMLGLIIEQASDTTYAAYLEDNVFKLAGLNHTYYCDERKVVKNHAHGYDMGPGGELLLKSYLDHTWPYAAGSLCSTAEDLVKWNQALHSGKVLSKEMYQKLITPGQLKDGTPIRYAKGLSNHILDGHQMISHGGGINGFLSDSRYYPEADLIIVTLINTAGQVSPAEISRKVSWELLDKVNEDLPDFEGGLSAYAGTYTGRGRGRDLTINVAVTNNELTVQSENAEKPDTLQYLGENTWRQKQDTPGNDRIEFRKNAEEEVVELRIDQVSGHYVLKKI